MRVKYLTQDLGTRLDGGICFYQGVPYHLRVCGDGIHVELFKLSSLKGKGLLVRTDSQDLDISAPSLGYVNFEGAAYYVMRSPDRKYKQLIQPASLVALQCGIRQYDLHEGVGPV